MEKGRYKVKIDTEFKENHLNLKAGDVYELVDTYNNEQLADIAINGQRYSVNQETLSKCSKSLKY